ncbi:MAG: nucleotidyl transferase AbiEii/AbiGii toxin family protein [Bacteroidales bacterium]|nr:nucleotidyl transferase AbiEii/AbiGii toxin family protein [Bacteroidales bacterium]
MQTGNTLHYETVSPLLINSLRKLMEAEAFRPFRLVGGTNLSLQFGHRISDDIDLFTDAPYGSLDFSLFERYLEMTFPFVETPSTSDVVGFGKMYYIGLNTNYEVKLDLMYTDEFFSPAPVIDGIRFASPDQVVAMKMQAIATGGRKKDWWDIHMLLDYYTLNEMLDLHKRWQPWTHDRKQLLEALTDFSVANNQPDPKCLLGKDWDFIKIDIIEAVEECL